MDDKEMLAFHKEMHFHEMEARDRLTFRIQMVFALVFTVYSIIGYMLRTLDYEEPLYLLLTFYLLVGVSFLISIACVHQMVRAFWGNEYKAMPFARDIQEYKIGMVKYAKEIKSYNESYPNAKQNEIQVGKAVEGYILNKFIECASHNAGVNVERSWRIHQVFKWLLILSMPFFLAGAVFILFDLDTSSPRKDAYIIDRALVEEVNKTRLSLDDIKKMLSKQKGE